MLAYDFELNPYFKCRIVRPFLLLKQVTNQRPVSWARDHARPMMLLLTVASVDCERAVGGLLVLRRGGGLVVGDGELFTSGHSAK